MTRAPAGRRRTVALLVDPNFGPYFWGNLLSACGTWFQALAQSVLVYRLTGDPFMVGVVNFAQFAAVVVLAPWAGSAADRYDRRTILIACQVAGAALTGVLAVMSALDVASAWSVIAVVLVIGSVLAFSTPAGGALIPSLATTDRLESVVALNSVTYNVARAVGPVLAAVVITHAGITEAFAINAASYVVFAVLLLPVRALTPFSRPVERPRLRESIAAVRRDPGFLWPLAIVAVVGMSTDPVTTLGPVFASEIYGLSDADGGYLIGAFGAGAVVAAFTLAGTRIDRRRIVTTLAIIGLGIAVYGASTNLPTGLVALFVAGFGFLATNTAATTLIQLRAGEAERGRIMALWSLSFLGARPLASLFDGAVAAAAGVRVAVILMSPPSLLMAGAVALVAHAMWRERSAPAR
jgi:MFS family permease